MFETHMKRKVILKTDDYITENISQNQGLSAEITA